MSKQTSISGLKPTLLIVGCGDVGLRVVKHLVPRWRIWALTSSPQRKPLLRHAGAMPISGNLDQPASLLRMSQVARSAHAVLHLAPPPPAGVTDPRTRALLQALLVVPRMRCLVYASTTGVYGDCQGQQLDETRPVAPATDRARRRLHAEAQVRQFGLATGVRVCILRIPGIYANDRDGGRPRERVQRGSPVLVPEEDVYTNHIHANDLARACLYAVRQGARQRIYNVCDDTDLKMGDYFDLVARLEGLPLPPRITRQQAQQVLGPMQLSFMSESRRIGNRRITEEWGLRLTYPTVTQGLLGR
jgi:nucleoside-diphosphate-sugar epimerase